MAISHYSTQETPDRAFALQKYLLLHSQHDALQKHLNQISTSPTPPTASPGWSSRKSSTDSTSSAPSLIPQRPSLHHRRSSLPDLPSESTLEAIEEDQDKIKNVNLQIKTTLTQLLNCEGVRENDRYRMWVQTRLMDAERELKSGKSRSCDRRKSVDTNGMFSF